MTEYYKHDSAIVDEGAKIGKGSRIWHFVHVCGGAAIGEGVSLGQNVFVGTESFIDDEVPNLITIQDDVIIAFRTTIVAHDDTNNKVAPITIKKGAYIGTGAIISMGVEIGENAIVGAGAVVTKNVTDNCTVVGIPAKPIK